MREKDSGFAARSSSTRSEITSPSMLASSRIVYGRSISATRKAVKDPHRHT
jgi:hypothetical protein